MMLRLATLLVVSSPFLSGIASAEPGKGTSSQSSSQVDEARAHFQRGADLFKEGNPDASLAEFLRAYQLVPNYRLLYNIGQVHVERHDYVSALRAFQDYLRQGATDVPAERREQVERDIASLRTRISELRVTSNVEGAELAIDGVPAGSLPLTAPLPVSAGTRRLTLTKKGYNSVERTITVTGGDKPELSIPLERLASPRDAQVKAAPPQAGGGSSLSTGTWASLAATGAFASGAVVFGLLARGKNQDLDASLARFPADRSSVEDTRSRLKLYAGLTDGCMVAAGVSAGLSIYFLLSGSQRTEAPKASHKASVRLVPQASGVAMHGEF
jgi:hypothetical protein